MRKCIVAVCLTVALLGAAPAGATSGADTPSEADAISLSGIVAGAACPDAACSIYDAISVDRGRIHHYGTLGGFASVAYGVNIWGDVAGQADTAATDVDGCAVSLAFVAHHLGSLKSIGTLPGFENSQAFAINSGGVVAGWAYNDDGTGSCNSADGYQAFVVRHGVMTALGTLGGSSSVAFGVNEWGRVVGKSKRADGQTRGFFSDRGALRELGTLGGDYSEARAVNNFGVIAGSSNLVPHGRTHAAEFLPDGTVVDLGTLGGRSSRAFGINDLGDIVGESTTANGATHAFRYHGGQMQDLGTFNINAARSSAKSINDLGLIVGTSDTGTIDPTFGPLAHGFEYDHTMHDLGPLR